MAFFHACASGEIRNTLAPRWHVVHFPEPGSVRFVASLSSLMVMPCVFQSMIGICAIGLLLSRFRLSQKHAFPVVALWQITPASPPREPPAPRGNITQAPRTAGS